MTATLPAGTIHNKTPADFQKKLKSNDKVLAAWHDITPLARNEFICWVTDAKKPETRARRVDAAFDKLSKGERRPCCWIGCTHRTDKQISPSVQAILTKRSGE